MPNSCGGCGACCETLPVVELKLGQFTRCRYLRDAFHAQGVGCDIYHRRPPSCRSWKCEWLKSDWPDELRPDRIGLVVNEVHDLINVNGVDTPATEIWVLPGHEDDWHTSDLANGLIQFIIERTNTAVLWRMKNGTAIAFFCDPKTGQLGRSAPHLSTPDDQHDLGSFGERMFRAEAMIRK